MTRMRVPAALAVAATTLLTSACGGSAADDSGETSASATGEPSDQPTAMPVPALTFVQDVPKDNCYALGKGDGAAEVAWFQSPVNVSASGRLVDIRAVDSTGVSVAVEDTQQVPLAGRTEGIGAVGDWPLTEDQVSRFIVVRNASDLVRADLRANQTLLPVLHLTAQRDSSVGEFVFVYEISNGQRDEITYPVDLRFAADCSKDG